MAETAVDKLIGLLNEANQPPKIFTEGNIKLGDFVASEDPEFNTEMIVRAVPGRGYIGQKPVRYQRLDISTIVLDATLRSQVQFTPEAIVSMLNVKLKLFLSVDDLEPFDIPELTEGQTETVVIQTKPSSAGFFGEFSVVLEFGKSWLDQVIGVRVLKTLNHPADETLRKKSARMMTWSKDFTSLRDAIKVTGGTYTDFQALQVGCAYMGVPTWSPGTITDQPTSAVPDSNPAFDRVVIQEDVNSGSLEGSIYLHYNNLEGV